MVTGLLSIRRQAWLSNAYHDMNNLNDFLVSNQDMAGRQTQLSGAQRHVNVTARWNDVSSSQFLRSSYAFASLLFPGQITCFSNWRALDECKETEMNRSCHHRARFSLFTSSSFPLRSDWTIVGMQSDDHVWTK